MHIPSTGVVFLPLIALMFLLRPSRLEELLIYMAIFQGAAVVNLGGAFSFGLSPYYFTACLLAACVALRWTTGRILFQKGEFAQKHLKMAALFVVWCVISAFLFPFFFEGTPVDSPRAGAEAVFYLALPLHWSFSNAGQAGYMVLNFFVLLSFADFCVKRPLERLMDAFTYSGVIVLLVGFYQIICYRVGLPFPASFFNSNGTWAQNYNQLIGSNWHRVSATFVEPSEAGGFLSSWLLFELILANWGSANRTRHSMFAILGCVVLLATTSSTGYATFALVMLFLVGRFAFGVLGQGRLPIRTGVTIATVVIVAAGFLALGHDASLLDAVLWNKSGSTSAVTRFATVWRAVAVMQDTYGFGAGLGSNRAFGMLAYIGSNLGIFGLAVLSYMLAQLFGETFGSLRTGSANVTIRVAIIACAAAFAANLISMALSGAEISDPRLWILWGMFLASMRVQTIAPCPQSDKRLQLSPTDVLYPSPTLG